jgi:hypothetical protein
MFSTEHLELEVHNLLRRRQIQQLLALCTDVILEPSVICGLKSWIQDLRGEPLQEMLAVVEQAVVARLAAGIFEGLFYLLGRVVRPADQADVIAVGVRFVLSLQILLPHCHQLSLPIPGGRLADELRC